MDGRLHPSMVCRFCGEGDWRLARGASLCDSRAAQVKRRVAIRPPAPFSSRAVLTPLADLQALPSGAGETAPDEPPEPP